MRRPQYRDRGVVLRTYRLGEADRIVVLLTEDHGKVRAVARGIRKTGSKFGARLEPGSHVSLLMVEGRDLQTVAQAEAIDSVAPLVAHLDRISAALAMLEAVDQLSLEGHPSAELYRMLVGALRTVSRVGGPMVVPAFFWKVLAAEGIRPVLDRCVMCGEENVPLVAFDVAHGGALCRACRSGAPLSAEALELMREVLGGRLNQALQALPGPVTHEVAQHAARAMEHHIERRLRTVAMFERL